jgi:ABC-type Fe3+-hydroxamate transport system substrate-binding protein
MRTRLITTAVVATLALAGCSSDTPNAKTPATTAATNAPGATTDTGPTTTETSAPPLTVPPQAPPGSTPLDLTGDILALDPVAHVLALQFGPLPGGLTIIATNGATFQGVAGFSALKVGQKAHVVGYGQRVENTRVFTAVHVTVTA